jgi:hypothetical protein
MGRNVALKQENNMYVFTGPGVSRGEPYIPDEVAKSIVDKNKLNKGDTISKHDILAFLKDNDLPAEMLTDVAMKIRNVFGVQPTFNESLISELSAVLEDRDPAVVVVESAEPTIKVLTESDINQIIEDVIQELFNNAEDYTDEVVATQLSMMPWEDIEELAWLNRILEDEEKNQFELCMESGSDKLVNAWITAVTRPHMTKFLDESISHELSEALGGQEVKLLNCLTENNAGTANLTKLRLRLSKPEPIQAEPEEPKTKVSNIKGITGTKTKPWFGTSPGGKAPKLDDDPALDDIQYNVFKKLSETEYTKAWAESPEGKVARLAKLKGKQVVGQVKPVVRGDRTLDRATADIASRRGAAARAAVAAAPPINVKFNKPVARPGDAKPVPIGIPAKPTMASKVGGALKRVWGHVKNTATVAKNAYTTHRDEHKARKEVAAQTAQKPEPTTPASNEPATPGATATPTAKTVIEPGAPSPRAGFQAEPSAAPTTPAKPAVGSVPAGKSEPAPKKRGILGRILGGAASIAKGAINTAAAVGKGALAGSQYALRGGQVGIGQVAGAAADLGKAALRAPGEEAGAYIQRRDKERKAAEDAKKKAAKDAKAKAGV